MSDESGPQEQGEAQPRTAKQQLTRLGLVIVLLASGYKYGLGPVIFAALKMPATVQVHRAGDGNCDLQLGWRRLKQPIGPSGVARFVTQVGMPERQGLVVRCAGTKRKLRVPVRPGGLTIVNYEEGFAYHLYDTAAVESETIDTSSLLRELAQRRDPAATITLQQRLAQLGDRATIRQVTGEIIRADNYRVRQYAGVGTRKLPSNTPLLARQPCELRFSNGSVTYSAATPETLTAQLRCADSVAVKLTDDVTVAIDAGSTIAINAKPDQLDLSLRTGAASQTVDGVDFSGSWAYAAHLQSGGAWTSGWHFSGSAISQGKRLTCAIDFPATGPSTTKVSGR